MKVNKLKKALNEIEVLKANSPSNLYYCKKEITKLDSNNFMGSGLILEIKDLSGQTKIKFMTSDGLKDNTIKELVNEITFSLNLKKHFF